MKRPLLTMILLLLLLNAASLYWFTRPSMTATSPTLADQSSASTEKRLVLVAEAPPEILIRVPEKPSKNESQTASVKKAVATPATLSAKAEKVIVKKDFCFVTAPFPGASSEDSVLKSLALIPDVLVNSEDKQNVKASTFWVKLKGSFPPTEGQRLLEELQSRGIKDISLTLSRSGHTSVSLGLYRLQESIQNRLRQLEALGYRAEVIELKRRKPARIYHINVPASSLKQARGLLHTYRKSFPKNPLSTVDCPASPYAETR